MLYYIGLSVIGLILLIIIVAFVFSEKFRKDVIASQGEASILGMFNVKGVIIILLTAIFVGAFIYIINISPSNSKSGSQGKSSQKQSVRSSQKTNHYIQDNNVIINDTAYYTASTAQKVCYTKDNFIVIGDSYYEIDGSIDLYYRVDSVVWTGGSDVYNFYVFFGEMNNDSIIWRKNPIIFNKTPNGRITKDSEFKFLTDPRWKMEYQVLMALGQPDEDKKRIQNNSIIVAYGNGKINRL